MAENEQLPPDDRPPEPSTHRGISRGLLWALALAVVVLTIASWMALSNEPRASDDVTRLDNGVPSGGLQPDAELVGTEAPGFSLPTLSGTNLALSDLRGRPVVVNFWASTCTPCLTEMPALEELHKRYGDKVAFVGVASLDQESEARKMAARTGITYESALDAPGQVLPTYGTLHLPATYVLDPHGVVRYQKSSGAVSPDELSAALDPLTS